MKRPKCWFVYRAVDLTDMKGNHVLLFEPMTVGTIEEMLTCIHNMSRYIHTVHLDWGTVSMGLIILPPAYVKCFYVSEFIYKVW